jgi:hypothetical protein
MQAIRDALPYLRLAVIAAILYAGWVFWSRQTPIHNPHPVRETTAAEADWARVYGGSEVRILQFYARERTLTEGDKSVICYGVLNAKSVRIEPPVAGITPSLNKCVEIAPERNTRYTLIAEGADGRAVSESFTLGVQADPDTLPKITTFAVMSQTIDYRGWPVYLVNFSVQNPEEVSIDPPAFPTLHRAPYGRFYVSPPKKTTYTLTVLGRYGHKAQQQLTLEGPKWAPFEAPRDQLR